MASNQNLRARSVMIDEFSWTHLTRYARLRSVEEERSVSVSELIRRGCQREILECMKMDTGSGEYREP